MNFRIKCVKVNCLAGILSRAVIQIYMIMNKNLDFYKISQLLDENCVVN